MAKKNKKWFIKVRGSYLPNSLQAWLLYIPFTAYLIIVLQSALRNESSALNILYAVFPQFVCAAVVMTWIASRKS